MLTPWSSCNERNVFQSEFKSITRLHWDRFLVCPIQSNHIWHIGFRIDDTSVWPSISQRAHCYDNVVEIKIMELEANGSIHGFISNFSSLNWLINRIPYFNPDAKLFSYSCYIWLLDQSSYFLHSAIVFGHQLAEISEIF